MGLKKSLLILVLAIFLASIAGVCASDVDDAIMASDDNLEIDQTTVGVASIETSNVAGVEEYNNVIGSCDENDKLNANPDGSFSELKNEIANADGELKLTKNYTYNPNNDSDYVDGIVIEKAIVIDGNGFSLNGNNSARVFKITSDGVILKNIDIINCLQSHSVYNGWRDSETYGGPYIGLETMVSYPIAALQIAILLVKLKHWKFSNSMSMKCMLSL